ncbi:MAG TPA: transglutaminase domain-containing protein [Gemmataceae bacterium]|nr:transglutaminase domain-containing protein [Gemmataceae bacterium]
MRKYGPLVLGLLFLSVPVAVADQPQGKVVADTWEMLQLGGYRVGHVHTVTREAAVKDAKVLRTNMQFELTLKRAGAVQKLKLDNGSDETADGKVLGISMRMEQVVQEGTVEEKGLHLKVNGGQIDKYVPWNDDVIGLYRQEQVFKDKKVKAGDKFTFSGYEPSITAVVTVRGKAGEAEEVATLKGKKKLLRVELASDPIAVPKPGSDETFKLQLPKMIVWLDKDWVPVRRQTDMPGLGTIVFQRTDRETATAAVETVPDILANVNIPLNRAIANPTATRGVVFRVTLKDDDDPTTALAQDARQEIKNAKGNSFELHVKAIRSPQKVEKPDAPVKEEYLKSCFFLKCDDPRVKALTESAVGEETEPLKKARRIERWVFENVRNDNQVPFVPADHVARLLKGDCRQHAMLAAAMCRAADVPSRTAVGLVYATDERGKPMMAYHMWTEVWVQGQWLAIDPELGQGSIAATHVKIADHSWYDTHSVTPLLSVARVLDKLSIEVISVNGAR